MSQTELKKSSDRVLIYKFLDLKRIAFVGISSNEKDFSRMIYNELVKREYEVVPVNPKIDDIDGVKVFASIKDIEPAVEGVFIITAPSTAEKIVQECIEANIKNIWLHRGVGKGSVNEKVLALCKDNGVEVVPGYCPFMFLPGTGFGHKLHGFFLRLTGSYPK